MNAVALPPSDEVSVLANAFSKWIENSASDTLSAREAPVFSVRNSTATLDAYRASKLIRAGLRAGRIDELVGLFGLRKKEDLITELNATGTSLWRWAKDDKSLPGSTIEQILRAMQLQLFAVDVFGNTTSARSWLHKPHPSLDGVAPSVYADNEFGAQKVRGMLAGLKYGGVV